MAKKSPQMLHFLAGRPMRRKLSYSAAALACLLVAGCPGGGGGSPPPPPSHPLPPNPNVIVFSGDVDTDGVTELYSFVVATGQLKKLNPAYSLASGINVTSYAVSPDAKFVAYVANEVSSGKFDVFVVPVDGSILPVLVSNVPGEAADDTVADGPIWAPDSSRIAYRSDELTGPGGKFNLRTVMPDGSGNTVVNPVGVGPGTVQPFSVQWSPDSALISYLTNVNGAHFDLYISLANSPASFNVSELAASAAVTEYSWSPDGNHMLFRSDRLVDERYELFTRDLSGAIPGAIVPVSGNLAGGGDRDVLAGSAVWAPNSTRIAFIADGTTDDVYNAYTVLPNGTGLVQLNISLFDRDVINTPSWAPDGSRVAYRANLESSANFELYTSQATIPLSNVKVNGSLHSGDVEVGPNADSAPAWSPDSSRLVYAARQVADAGARIYIGNAAGVVPNQPTRISPPAGSMVGLGDAGSVWSPDGSRVLFTADADTVLTNDLYSATSTATIVNRITRNPSGALSLSPGWKWSSDSTLVVYIAEQNTAGAPELYASPFDGSSNSAISGNLVAGEAVNSFVLAP